MVFKTQNLKRENIIYGKEIKKYFDFFLMKNLHLLFILSYALIELNVQNGIIRERLKNERVFVYSERIFDNQLLKFPLPNYMEAETHGQLGLGCTATRASKEHTAGDVRKYFLKKTEEIFSLSFLKVGQNANSKNYIGKRSLDMNITKNLEPEFKSMISPSGLLNDTIAARPKNYSEIILLPEVGNKTNFLSTIFNKQIDWGVSFCDENQEPNLVNLTFETEIFDKILFVLSSPLQKDEPSLLHALFRAYLIVVNKEGVKTYNCGHNGSPRVKNAFTQFPILLWSCSTPKIDPSAKVFIEISVENVPDFFCHLRFSELVIRYRNSRNVKRKRRFLDFYSDNTNEQFISDVEHQLATENLDILTNKNEVEKLENKFLVFSNQTNKLFQKVNRDFCYRQKNAARASFDTFLSVVFETYFSEILAEITIINAGLSQGESFRIFNHFCNTYNDDSFSSECSKFYRESPAKLNKIFFSASPKFEGIFFSLRFTVPIFSHYVTGDVFDIYPIPVPFHYNKKNQKFLFQQISTRLPKTVLQEKLSQKILNLDTCKRFEHTVLCSFDILNNMFGPNEICLNSIFSKKLNCQYNVYGSTQSCLPVYERRGRFLAVSHLGPIQVNAVSQGLSFQQNIEFSGSLSPNITIISKNSKIVCKNQVINFMVSRNETKLQIVDMPTKNFEKNFQHILNQDLEEMIDDSKTFVEKEKFLRNNSLENQADFLAYEKLKFLPFVPKQYQSSYFKSNTWVFLCIITILILSICFFTYLCCCCCCGCPIGGCSSCCCKCFRCRHKKKQHKGVDRQQKGVEKQQRGIDNKSFAETSFSGRPRSLPPLPPQTLPLLARQSVDELETITE